MKREQWFRTGTAAVLAFLLSFGGLGCLATAFDLSCDLWELCGFCFLTAAVFALCFRFKWGSLALLCLLALAAGYLWQDGTAAQQTRNLLNVISVRYDRGYGCGYILPGSEPGIMLPLWVTAVAVILVTVWTVQRRQIVILAAILAALPLIASLVVTDTVPAALFLYLFLLGLLLLIFTSHARRRPGGQDNRQAVFLLLPTAAALGLLFWAVPKEGYVNHAQVHLDKIMSLAARLPVVEETPTGELRLNISLGGDERRDVNLRTVGTQPGWRYPVMEVTASRTGTVYLRGQDYDVYSGTGWTAGERRWEEFGGGDAAGETVTIQTRGVKNVLYLPYYPQESQAIVGGRVSNPDGLTEYSFSLSKPTAPPPMDETQIQFAVGQAGQMDTLVYRTLPLDSQWAKDLVLQITADCETDAERAAAIAEYVRNSAVYDRKTSKMPADNQDFVRWFLEESDRGYCVHFASATTVLLRAAGIPARYVTGYMVQTRAGEPVTVTADMAHAWAEYFDGSTWVILEATPAAQEEETTLPEEITTRPSEAETQTFPSMEATQPTAPSVEPTEETVPPAPEEKKVDFGAVFTVTVTAVLTVLAVLCQGHARLYFKEQRWNSGRRNQKALARFRQAEELAKVMKLELPEELEELAQRAKFSQHTLTAQELRRFDAFREEAFAIARKRPWYMKLLYRYFWAVY